MRHRDVAWGRHPASAKLCTRALAAAASMASHRHMIRARKTVTTLFAGAAFCVLAALVRPQGGSAFAASEVKAVVNGVALTTGDVARRQAFLRLQHQKADAKTAEESLVDETLKRQEISRVRMSVSKGRRRCVLCALCVRKQALHRAAYPNSHSGRGRRRSFQAVYCRANELAARRQCALRVERPHAPAATSSAA